MRTTFANLVSKLPTFDGGAGPIAWAFIWIGAVGLAALIHLAFLVQWPDHFLHEDSGPYLEEVRLILTGHYADAPVYRPSGVALFLVLLSKLFSPNILVFITAQHVLSVLAAILIAATIRFAGAPRFWSLLAFLLAALFPRTLHYDNAIGAETLTVFLTSLSAWIAAGIVFRKWPPLASIGLGLSLGAMLACRSAAVGPALIILLWLAIFIDARWVSRVAVAGGIALALYVAPAQVHRIVGKPPGGGEVRAVMAFAVGYSADFDRGVQLERKSQARAFVMAKRAVEEPLGWTPADYQWPLDAIALMRKSDDSDEDYNKAVRDIFIETITTPSTLAHHLKHCVREMYTLMFDGNEVAQRVSNPLGYRFFVERDTFPIFHTPTGIKQGSLFQWLLPSAGRLPAGLDALLTFGYSITDTLVWRLTISSEYDFRPGPIRWLSSCTLILLFLLLAAEVGRRFEWRAQLPRNLVAGGFLMTLIAIVNAAFPAFLVYGLHRYGYYVTPFMAGATGILGAVLSQKIKSAKKRHLRDAPDPTTTTAS